ncbi:MAG TPA: GNAT family N-acetyltransferase, partial [Telluria sp.]
TFSSAFHEKEEIPEHVLRDLIRLSEERISQKVSAFAHDEARILALAKECGFVHVLTIDGKVCAGTINYYIGSNVFLEVLGRDPAYSSFSIGLLTMYLSACESIRRGKRQYFLGGGRFDYKQKLLGILSEADRVEIYRSHGAMLIHLANAVATLAHAWVRRAKVWVHAHKTHPVSRLAFSVFARYR